MAGLRISLLTITPRNSQSGAAVTVRLAGGGVAGYRNFGSADWYSGLAGAPAIVERLGFDGDGFSQGAVVSAVSIDWTGPKPRADSLKALYWRGAPFTLHIGPDGGADGDMTLRLAGRVVDIEGAGVLSFALADRSVDYDKPVISATFAGTGGIEGDAEIKGTPKQRAFGRLFNLSFSSLLKANNIHVIADPAKPINAFDQVYDSGNAASGLTVIAWAGSIAATLAALIAALAPDGGAAVAPSIACIKWWHANPGKLTADIRGEIGAGYVDRPVDIALAILASIAAPTIDEANVTAHRVARDHECGWLIADIATTALGKVQSLLSGVSSWFSADPDGVIRFGTYAWTASVQDLSSATTEIIRAFKPVSKVMIGWRTNQTVMARGDIAEVVFAADVSGLGALATQNTIDFASQIDATGKPEINADVTMVVTSPPPISVAYNFDSSIKAGQLPKTLNFKLLRGTGTDVTTLANWSAVLKSGSAAFTIGAATGILEITTLSSDAVFEASASYLGVVRKGQSSASRKLDDPPVMGGGAGGATSDATSSISATTSSAYASANTRILTIAAGSGGVVNLSFAGEFTRATSGNASAFGKWQWRVVGGTFADVATEIASASSASTSGPPEPDTTAGTIAVNQQKSGLTTAVNYEFQLLLRANAGVTLNWLGSASGAGA